MAFDRFLDRSDLKASRKRRAISIAVVALVQGALITIAISRSFAVEELSPRPPEIVINLPRAHTAAGGPNDVSRFTPPRRKRGIKPVTPTTPVQPQTPTPPPPPEDKPSSDEGGVPDGDPNGRGLQSGKGGPVSAATVDEGPGPAGPGVAPAAVVRTLPPSVIGQHCRECPNPHLPEGYRRLGNTYRLMAKICVDIEGRVTKIQVLQGISADADAKVVETLATWRFSPAMIDGRAVPFCTAQPFVFTTQ